MTAALMGFAGGLLIAVLTWLAARAVRGVADGVIALHPADVADNLHARRVQTQTRVLGRIAASTVLVAGIAFMLMTFPRARQLGTSILASAGVMGLVVGIAMVKSGLTAAQVSYWDRVLGALAASPDWKQELARSDLDNVYRNSADTAKHWKQEYDEVKAVLVELGLAKA